MLSIPYAAGLGIAASEGFANGSGWLGVPVLGPWAALAKRPDPCDGVDDAEQIDADVGRCVAEPMVRGMLVLDGVFAGHRSRAAGHRLEQGQAARPVRPRPGCPAERRRAQRLRHGSLRYFLRVRRVLAAREQRIGAHVHDVVRRAGG